MKKLFSSLYYKWLVITFSCAIAFHALDYLFGTSSSINNSFFEYGFLAFVILWCGQQDKIKREGK